MRKIIQISVSTNLDGYNKSQATVALCDDGTVWCLETFDGGWVKYPDIPQDKTLIFSRSDDSESPSFREGRMSRRNKMTTQKKYELTDEFITLLGKKLYRIKALIAFGDVDAGDIGGYIESEDNLSHEGDAKVYGDAQVFGNAWVYGNVGSENGTLTVFNGKDGLIVTRGCFEGTVDEFLQKSAEVHDEKINREYTLLIEVAKSRILG